MTTIQKKVNDDYIESINLVLRYIDDNLESDLTIDHLAEIALFSKFHFHRIFKGAVGESLIAYVIRRRLERAAFLLKRFSELSVTEVALRVGFKSPEHFSRSFKEKFDVTANEFRQSDINDPKSLKNSKMYQAVSENSFYHIYEQSRKQEPENFAVTVVDQPEYQVAAITDTFGENGMNLVNAYNELIDWAKSVGVFTTNAKRFGVSRDDIEITPADQYRMEFSISIPDGIQPTGRIETTRVYGGTYALIPVKGDIHRVAKAWDYLYRNWLPTSGYRPLNQPAIEVYHQGPETLGWETFDLDVGIPVIRWPPF